MAKITSQRPRGFEYVRYPVSRSVRFRNVYFGYQLRYAGPGEMQDWHWKKEPY